MTGNTIRRLRRLHLYVGMVFAPAIIFFAFSGMIQTIGLQDGPAPPAWIKVMANIHKKQVAFRPQRPTPAGPAMPRSARPPEAAAPASTIPFKAFVLLLSLGLIASAVLGIVIALTNRATRRMSWIMLAVGLVLPIALLAI